MGRTKRKRKVRQLQERNISLNHEESTINLRQWMEKNNFSDPLDLQLRDFVHTGRGVTSKTSVKANDVLIRVPLDLLISFDTAYQSGLLDCIAHCKRGFSTQAVLAFYLAIEKHKEEASVWNHYVNSLPYPEPLLPWTCKLEDIDIFPGEFKSAALKRREMFTDSFFNLEKSILPCALCECCNEPIVRVLKLDLFQWAYVLVNTRAVYVDPAVITSRNNLISILSDEPSMALCPFLDMFNHSHLAATKVDVVNIQGRCFYELCTLTTFRRNEQFFISYGSHDNEKLLMEYGFIIPGNILDCVQFSFKEIIDVLQLTFNDRQFKYIKNHGFDVGDIYISQSGDMSFNLRAILLVHSNRHMVNIDSVVFGDSYPSDFERTSRTSSKTLLNFRIKVFQDTVDDFKRVSVGESEGAALIERFLLYRIDLVKKLLL